MANAFVWLDRSLGLSECPERMYSVVCKKKKYHTIQGLSKNCISATQIPHTSLYYLAPDTSSKHLLTINTY